MTRLEVIKSVLTAVYGDSWRVPALAEYLDEKWEDWKSNEDGLHYKIHMAIWNWFPGGGTAEYAANQVVDAVRKNVDV